MSFSAIIYAFLAIAATSTPTTNAFLSNFGGIPGPWKEDLLTPRRQTRIDTSELIEEALTASQKYGASSPEARLAWETVEEIDASDNTATLGMSSNYQEQIQALTTRLKQQQPAMASLNNMAAEIENIKLSAADTTPTKNNAKLQEAMDNAKRLTLAFGVRSSEAKVAWEVVEEIASSDRGENAMGGMLTPEDCLVDAPNNACEALEELNN